MFPLYTSIYICKLINGHCLQNGLEIYILVKHLYLACIVGFSSQNVIYFWHLYKKLMCNDIQHDDN